MLDLKTALCFFAAISFAQAQTISPTPVIAIEGSTATTVTCSPRPDNGIPILSFAPPGSNDFGPVENVIHIADDGMESRTFYVAGLTRSDNGSQFQCSIGSVPSDPALLLVYYPPSIDISSSTSSVVEGNEITFTFSVEAYPEPSATVTRIGEGPTPSFEVTESTVTLSDVMREYAGTYVLSLSNAGGVGEVTFELIVFYPPSINISSNIFSVVEGDEITFTFSVDRAYPEPSDDPTVTRIGEGPTPSFEVTESTVTLSDVMREYAGTYVLSLSNAGGVGEVTFEVIVFYSPSITILSNTLVEVKVGDDITITFSVDANPEPPANPTLTRMNEGQLPPSIEVTDSTVKFYDVMEEHFGVYVLTSSNVHGTGEATFELSGAVVLSTSILTTLLMIVVAMLLL